MSTGHLRVTGFLGLLLWSDIPSRTQGFTLVRSDGANSINAPSPHFPHATPTNFRTQDGIRSIFRSILPCPKGYTMIAEWHREWKTPPPSILRIVPNKSVSLCSKLIPLCCRLKLGTCYLSCPLFVASLSFLDLIIFKCFATSSSLENFPSCLLLYLP